MNKDELENQIKRVEDIRFYDGSDDFYNVATETLLFILNALKEKEDATD